MDDKPSHVHSAKQKTYGLDENKSALGPTVIQTLVYRTKPLDHLWISCSLEENQNDDEGEQGDQRVDADGDEGRDSVHLGTLLRKIHRVLESDQGAESHDHE